MATNNAINLNGTGIAKYDGAGTFSAITVTNHAPLLGAASNGITSVGPLTNGQLLIGSTGNDAAAATLTAGTGITVSNGAGSIQLDAVGGGLTWASVGAGGALAVNHGYICSGGAALSFSLPAASALGDVISITLDGSTSWTITQAANQQIRMGSVATTLGAGGSLASTAQGDTITMVCKTANLLWVVLSSMGNITVV